MRTLSRTLAVVAGAAVLAVVPTAAEAKTKTALDVGGFSAGTPTASGFAIAGFVTGEPFHGSTVSGSFDAVDGTRPTGLQCEPAAGSLTLGAVATGQLTIAVDGELCDQFGSPRGSGTWTVTDGTGSYAKAKGSGTFGVNNLFIGAVWGLRGELKS